MKILHIVECAGGVERYLAMLPFLEQRDLKQYSTRMIYMINSEERRDAA